MDKHTKRLIKNSMKKFESNPLLLSLKSSYKLLLRRSKEYYNFDYPLLVVSGLQRSGTHLFNNLLCNHHQVLSYYRELQIGRPNKFHWPNLQNETNIKKRFVALIPRNMAKHFLNINDHENFIFDFNYFKNLFIKLEKNNNHFNPRTTLDNFFTAYFNAYLNCNHSNFYNEYKYIVATIPGLIIFKRSIKSFFKDYPDGKIFVLIREPYIWWNSAQNHTKKLNKFGLERYEKTLINTKWACNEYKNNVFSVSFDHLVANTEKSMQAILKCADIDFNEIVSYPSKFPYYANDNSTFGHKKTKSVLKEKIKRELKLSKEDRLYIKSNIFPLYEEVLEEHTINFEKIIH
jgi:hypothetical protein